jgi:hypothetical protein
MGFEIFINKKGKKYTPSVSIFKTAFISFNKILIEKINLRQFRYAVFYFNSETSEIGIEFTNQEKAGAYRILKTRSACVIGCKAFLNFFNITYPQFDLEMVHGKKLYVIKVKTNSGKKL